MHYICLQHEKMLQKLVTAATEIRLPVLGCPRSLCYQVMTAKEFG